MNSNKPCVIQYIGQLDIGDLAERIKFLRARFRQIESYVTVHGGTLDENRIDARANTIKAEIPVKYFKKVEAVLNKQGYRVL